MVHAWAGSNWFLRVGKDTLEHYIALHLHLFTLANTEGWTYAQVAVKYYATKLAQFRKTNTSWLVCLVKIYIFLRDARKNDFYAAKLQEKRNHSMLAELTTLKGGGGGGTGSGRGGCKKCGTDHPGGVKKCPFRNLSDADAKKRANQLMVKFATTKRSTPCVRGQNRRSAPVGEGNSTRYLAFTPPTGIPIR